MLPPEDKPAVEGIVKVKAKQVYACVNLPSGQGVEIMAHVWTNSKHCLNSVREAHACDGVCSW